MPDLSVPGALGAAGAALWGAIVGDVADGWELDARDVALLRRACELEDLIAALGAALAAEGATTTGSKGQVRVHPAVSELRGLALAQRALLAGIDLEDPAQRIAEARLRTASRTAEWRRRSQGVRSRAGRAG